MTYSQPAGKLADIGVMDFGPNIRNKIIRANCGGVSCSMFNGNRGARLKARLIAVAVIVASLSAGWLVYWGLAQSADYERQAIANARHYSVNAYQQDRQTCLRLVTEEQPRCIAVASRELRDNERSEWDLVAQLQSALWAYVMALAAAIGMGLSGIGVFLVWITFRETKDGNTISRSHQRARIIFLAEFRRDRAREINEIILECENAGGSLALNCQGSFLVVDSVPDQPPDCLELSHEQTIKPGVTASLLCAEGAAPHQFLVGRIEYSTIFGDKTVTYACFGFKWSEYSKKWFAVSCKPDTWPNDS